MLMLIFSVGEERYALDSSHAIEIIPMVLLRQIPQTPDYVAGVLNYRGTMIPVIDLSQLMCGHPSRCALSTRIAILEYRHAQETPDCLGVIAERMTETLTTSTSEFANMGMQLENAPYLGDTLIDEKGTIQCICVQNLLSGSERTYFLPMEEKRVR